MPVGVIDNKKWMQHAGANRIQSIALLLFMGGFLGLLGWLLWGEAGVFWLLIMGVVGVSMNPSTSPRWVMRMYGAQRIGPAQAPELSAAVTALVGWLGGLTVSHDGSNLTVLLTGLIVVIIVTGLANLAVSVFTTALFPLLVIRLYRSMAGPGELITGLGFLKTTPEIIEDALTG